MMCFEIFSLYFRPASLTFQSNTCFSPDDLFFVSFNVVAVIWDITWVLLLAWSSMPHEVYFFFLFL